MRALTAGDRGGVPDRLPERLRVSKLRFCGADETKTKAIPARGDERRFWPSARIGYLLKNVHRPRLCDNNTLRVYENAMKMLSA